MKSVQLTMSSPAGNLQPGVDPRRTVAVDDKNAFPHRVTMAMGHQRFLPVTLAVPYHACMDMPFGQSPLLAAGVARLPARVCDARFDPDPVHLFPLGFDKQLVRFAEYHPVPASRPWLLLACFEHRLPALFLLLTPQLAEFTRPAVNRGVAHHRGQAQLFPVCRCFPEGLVRCLHHQLRRQPRTNSLALVQAQRLIQKVPITSCPVPIALPPVGDRPNQRVQRSWLEVLQHQPTGPLTRQLFVQPLQQFPQGRLQELGALLAHVFLQSLEAPTIRRYSKDSAELLHKFGAHGRPHILSRCGGLCEVSLFSRQVANPAWTASYPQKTLLYPALGLSQAFRGTKPVSVCFHGVPEMIRCIKREIPPERFRPTSAMGTPAWSTPRPSCATRFARLVACRLMSSSESSARTRNSSTLFMTWSSRPVLRQHSTSMMAAKPRRLQLRPRCLTRSAKVSTWLSAAPRPRKPSVEIPLAARRTR